jgi:hypothetical protein
MRALPLSFLVLLSTLTPALADGVYKDRERFDERTVSGKKIAEVADKKTTECARRPVRVTNMSPGYAGSHMGLGRPSYHGSPRPDPPEW